MTQSWRCSISWETIACDASASSRRAGNPAFPMYMAAERTISRMTAVARLSEETAGAASEAFFFSEDLFSTCGNKRNSRAHQQHANPPNRAHVFAQNIFRAERAHDVTQRRRGNHKTDSLPREQHQHRIKSDGHQWYASPKPSITHRAPKKRQKLSRAQPRGFADRLHAAAHGDFTA